MASAVLVIGFGGWIGEQIMPRVRLPATTLKRKGWNKGQLIGQKRPLLPKQVWAISARLELAGCLRDLALFNVAIDSKLRGCDLVKLAENTRETVLFWGKSPEMFACPFMFPSHFHDRPHISTRQYGRLMQEPSTPSAHPTSIAPF